MTTYRSYEDVYKDWTSVTAHHRLIHIPNNTGYHYHLKPDVMDWLFDNVEAAGWASKMVWDDAPDWKSRITEYPEGGPIGWFTMYFKHERDAILFKLRWS